MGRSSDFSTIPLSTRFETCQGDGAACEVELVRERRRPSRAVGVEPNEDLAGGLPPEEGDGPPLPRVEGRVEVVGASADPLDRDLAVADEPTEVVLRLSGGDVEVAAHPVEVDARRLADVSADPGSGVRHGCSS